jgi:hypothetical protein
MGSLLPASMDYPRVWRLKPWEGPEVFKKYRIAGGVEVFGHEQATTQEGSREVRNGREECSGHSGRAETPT